MSRLPDCFFIVFFFFFFFGFFCCCFCFVFFFFFFQSLYFSGIMVLRKFGHFKLVSNISQKVFELGDLVS